MDFLTDFMEGIQDFRVVGDPSGKAIKTAYVMFPSNVLYYSIFVMFSGFCVLYL